MMLDQDATIFVKVFLTIVATLLPIVNPVGSAPIFLSLTHGANTPTRKALALAVALNSFLLLLGSLILGNLVLRLFGLSIPVVQVAGGLVLCLLAIQMLSDEPPSTPLASGESDAIAIARAFYPLTLPLTVDPGAIAVAVTIGANHSHNFRIVAVWGAMKGAAPSSIDR